MANKKYMLRISCTKRNIYTNIIAYLVGIKKVISQRLSSYLALCDNETRTDFLSFALVEEFKESYSGLGCPVTRFFRCLMF